MQFDKVSLFYIAPDASVRVRTTVSANGAACVVEGQPMIEIGDEEVQIGCVRMTRGALLRLATEIAMGHTGLIQTGDYKTADPNTRKDGASKYDNTGSTGTRT